MFHPLYFDYSSIGTLKFNSPEYNLSQINEFLLIQIFHGPLRTFPPTIFKILNIIDNIILLTFPFPPTSLRRFPNSLKNIEKILLKPMPPALQ
jgi:hypothetical protein